MGLYDFYGYSSTHGADHSSQAFVLTQGTTHYRTDDRGQTWRSFEVPIAPSYVARPLAFHSDPSKYGYIIYQGTKCEREGGWSSICHDEVRSHLSSPNMPSDRLHRLTTRKRRSLINQNCCSLRLLNALSRIAQKISSTRLSQISFIALRSIRLPRMAITPSRRRVSSLPSTFSRTRSVLRILVSLAGHAAS